MEEYKYANLPITPAMIEEVIILLFNGTINRRDVIINRVLDYHISNGGLSPAAQDFSSSVKKALSKMMEKGWAVNKATGFWEIEKKDAPIIDESTLDDDPIVLEDMPTHKIYGKGNHAVYLYYLSTYKKLAQLQGDTTWPCKIGRTDRDPLTRILSQASTSLPEKPTIEFIIKTDDSSLLETLIHAALKLQNKHIQDSPGSEWFITNSGEVIDIITCIKKEILDS